MSACGDLRRTALVIPPRGRAVLCVWAALPGLLAAPFVFYRSAAAGAGFCLVWAAAVFGVWAWACSFAAALGAHSLTLYAGVLFPVRRQLPRCAVTGVVQLRTPLLRLAGVSLLVVTVPGMRAVLPAVPSAQAAALARLLMEDGA